MVDDPFFGDFINQALADLDRPASWLAKRLGVSNGTVSRWITGLAKPRLTRVVSIADLLGIQGTARQDLFRSLGYSVQIIEGSGTPQTLAATPDLLPPALQDGPSISHVYLTVLPTTLNVAWVVNTSHAAIQKSHRQKLEVRLYCESFPQFGQPYLQSAKVVGEQNPPNTQDISTLFENTTVTDRNESPLTGFRAGLPTIDLHGHFLPIYFDLKEVRIYRDGVTVRLSVDYPITTPLWLRFPRRIWAVFIYHGTIGGGPEIAYETDVIQHKLLTNDIQEGSVNPVTNVPQVSPLFIGRDADLEEIKRRVGNYMPGDTSRQMILTGWPGVGKTSVIRALANDSMVKAHFPDAILWVSVGETPNYLRLLAEWGWLLGLSSVESMDTISTATARLQAALQHKRALVVIDDVWRGEDALPLLVGGANCFTLITTRFQKVADQLATVPSDKYILGVLSLEFAQELLGLIAPTFVTEIPNAAEQWLRDIELLPLSILVGGRLLEREMLFGSEHVLRLLKDLRLLNQQAPKDRYDPETGVIPTVRILLEQSTNHLDPETREYFAFLGAFAPKPATFDALAMQSLWQVEDVRLIILKLIDYGLLEPIGSGRFWMHALLVEYARTLLEQS